MSCCGGNRALQRASYRASTGSGREPAIRSGQNDRERASEAGHFRIQRPNCNHCYRTGYRCDVSIFRERRAPSGTRFGCAVARIRSRPEGSALTRYRGVVVPRRLPTNRSSADRGVKYEHYPSSY